MRRVDYLPLADITPATRNPKHHDGPAIARSIDHFGLAELPLIDDRTGRLVAGHGRIDHIRAARDAGQQPPDGVRVDDDGTWLVPVVRGWASRSDDDAHAYGVASNRLADLGGWDDRALAELLDDLADAQLLDVTGYTPDALAAILDGLRPDPPALTGDPDDAPPPAPVDRPTLTTAGDLWLLGPHRLAVANATNPAALAALADGRHADTLWTDPPYGVDYVGKTADALTITGDTGPGVYDLLVDALRTAATVLHPGAPAYIASPPGPGCTTFAAAITNAGWALRQQLVWVKDQFVLGHSDYHYRHEPVWTAYTPGGTGRPGRGGAGWYGDNAQTSVFEHPRPARSADHPTMKPVGLIAAMLVNSTPPGGTVLDPFAGSGSTLIAAATLGATAWLVEVDPRYADVICARWQAATGEQPVNATTGRPVDFTPAPV